MMREPDTEQPEPESEARVLIDRANEVRASDHNAAIELARQALELAREQDDFSAATAALDMLISSDQLGEQLADEATGFAARALEHEKKTGNKRRQAQALNVLSGLARLKADCEEEERRSLEMLELAQTMDEPVYLSVAYRNLAITYRNRSDFEKALEWQEKDLELSQQLGDSGYVGGACMTLGLIHADMGNWDKALELYFRALAETEKTADDAAVASYYNNIGELYARRGKLDRALFYLEQAHAVSKRCPASILHAEVLGTLGEAAFANRDLVTARDCYEQDEQLCRRHGYRAELAEVLRRRAEMDVAQGQPAIAGDRLGEALVLSRQIGDRREEANVLRVMGELQLSLGETESAVEPLARSLELLRCSQVASGYELACSLLSLGRYLVESDRDGETELNEAVGIFERLGNSGRTEQARAMLDASRSAGAEAAATRHSGIVGADTTLRDIFDLLQKVAATDITLLILGESGTGKELVAQEVHDMSKRRDGPFVAVNCAAIPENLLEVELFGIERGTATGVAERAGKFEQADRGTLFLDEVGDMSPGLQARLLRVLQDRTFERVGARKPTRVDVRIIAATNRDLDKDIAEGRFREDLYYRLNVVSVTLPPLRERKADIPALAEHYVERYRQEYAKQVSGLSDDCLQCMLEYDWPGNVRELKHVVERALLMTQGDQITSADIPAGIRTAAG
ncbi:MAG: sigma 54-interacting transcriptional regulator [candidate division WOR-3 bacterium]|nr:MAG: sigma 54-interacting transcriptional regulator [candidate division WOR-3 bacterium]